MKNICCKEMIVRNNSLQSQMRTPIHFTSLTEGGLGGGLVFFCDFWDLVDEGGLFSDFWDLAEEGGHRVGDLDDLLDALDALEDLSSSPLPPDLLAFEAHLSLFKEGVGGSSAYVVPICCCRYGLLPMKTPNGKPEAIPNERANTIAASIQTIFLFFEKNDGDAAVVLFIIISSATSSSKWEGTTNSSTSFSSSPPPFGR